MTSMRFLRLEALNFPVDKKYGISEKKLSERVDAEWVFLKWHFYPITSYSEIMVLFFGPMWKYDIFKYPIGKGTSLKLFHENMGIIL